jgi:soluble lytic murein transglycosylase-like protein
MADWLDEAESLFAEPDMSAMPTAAPVAAEPTGYTSGQLLFDVLAGPARAGAGIADLASFLNPLRAASLQPSYSEQLAEAKTGLAEYFGVRPDTKVQKLAEFLAPIPGPGKLRMLGDVAAGGLAYIGSELGEQYFPESPGAQLALTLGLPTTAVLGTQAVRSGVPTLGQAVGLIAGSDEALRNAAKAEVLAAAGEEGAARLKLAQSLSNMSQGTGGVPLTAAEIAQTPSLAKYQQAIRQTQEGGNILTPTIETRQTELAAALNRFGIEPQQGDFALGLRTAAEQAAATKATEEANLLFALGIEDIATRPTKGERGIELQKSLLARSEDAYEPVRTIWNEVDKKTKMDVAPQLDEAVKTFNEFDDLTKSRMSGVAQNTIQKAESILGKEDGLITIKDYQSLRASANAALRNASKGTDRAEINLMNSFKDSLDNIDESAIIKGGSGEQVAKLTDAIAATKDYYKTFGRGVVGEIIKQKGGELTLKASQVVDRALKYPENVSDIISKFGKQSDEAVALRSELKDRLSKQKNPTRYLGENQDLYKKAFDDDYSSIVKYAQSKGQKAPFEEFAKVTDTIIPNKIFADTTQAKKFVNSFKNTELFQYARSKFINTKLTKSGDPLENLAKNKKIAQEYFPDDLDALEAVLKDMEVAKSPQKLAAAATKGQSWTSQMTTTLGAIMSARGLVTTLQKQGPKTGAMVGAVIGAPAGPAGAAIGSAIGSVGGYIMSRIGDLRDSQLNELAGQILANPSLLELAKAPPTTSSVANLLNRAAQIGYLGTKAQQEAQSEMAATESAAMPETGDWLNEAESLFVEPTPAPAPESIKVGKQNISIPTGKEFAPPSLVRAVMKAESAGKQEAISPKGARGLMQLMPGTARDLGVNPDDPQENVEGGSKLLRRLLNKYDSQEIALAAYNWGPGNIDKAIRKVKAAGKEVTWANILSEVKVPQETRKYVPKVISSIVEA